MLYLLDANVLISADALHYPLKRIPQFWVWLLDMGEAGHVKMPYEIYHEIAISKGDLKEWLTTPDAVKKLLLDEHIDRANLQKVMNEGYAPNLNDSQQEQMGQDPFLIGYALPYSLSATVVTREVSKPSKQGHNRKVPDVCKHFHIRCISDFDLYRELNFTIK